jgi:hypothetical protein
LVRKKTGLDFFDNLSDEDRELALKNMEIYRASLTQEERTKQFESLYRNIREIRKEYPEQSASMSDKDIMRAIANGVDLEKEKMKMVEIFERNGFHAEANYLKGKRLMIDCFKIDIRDDVEMRK